MSEFSSDDIAEIVNHVTWSYDEMKELVALLRSPLRMYLIDLNMPLGSMIVFMVKWLIASVIAVVLVTGAIFMVGGILMTVLGLIGLAFGSN